MGFERQQAGPVQIRLAEGWIELTFPAGFSWADVEAVKQVRGRRWRPARRVWLLPEGPATLAHLETAFGPRLLLEGEVASRTLPAPPARNQSASGAHETLDTLRRVLRTRGYSPKTEKAYVGWVRRFLTFHAAGPARAEELDRAHAEAFLEHLATAERLAARSRNQAAAALAFMFREILGRDVMADVVRAKGPRRMPVVLTHREVLRVLRELVGKYFLMVVLFYSAGLRVEECLRLRVKDVDFELRQILVRNGKGRKDRFVPLAERAHGLLRAQLRRVAARHRMDRTKGHGWAPIPDALHRKKPSEGYELGWQFVFPSSTIHIDPATGRRGRGSLHATAVQREVKRAVRASGITKPATCHTFRHSFATEALRGGCDIRSLQHVMGHKDIRTTMIYLHVLEATGHHIRSPLDRPDDPEDPGFTDETELERPWSEADLGWDLAAKQWGRKRSSPRPES